MDQDTDNRTAPTTVASDNTSTTATAAAGTEGGRESENSQSGNNQHKRHRSHRGGRHHHSGANRQNRPADETIDDEFPEGEEAGTDESVPIENVQNGNGQNEGSRNGKGGNGKGKGGNGNRNGNRNGSNGNGNRQNGSKADRSEENASDENGNDENGTGGASGARNAQSGQGGKNRNRNRNRGDRNDRDRGDRGNRGDRNNRDERAVGENDASVSERAGNRGRGLSGRKDEGEWVDLSREEVLPEVSQEELAAISESVLEPRPEVDPGPMITVVGVRFNDAGKVYYFDPGDATYESLSFVIVETSRGPEYGEVIFGNRPVREKAVIQPLRPVLRAATPEDTRHHAENLEKEKDAFKTGLARIAAHGLDMKLVDVQYAFDRSKLLFYFTSAGRVDFRELVKDLASIFRTRIELRQIGIRDEAKMLGGIGACGRSLCCTTFLPDFAQVSIKMAKEQNLSLNSSKVSGTCGRLMCCLNYEYQTYVDALRRLPPVDSTVRTPEGEGRVVGISAITESVKVSLPGEREKDERVVKVFPLDKIEVLSRAKKAEND